MSIKTEFVNINNVKEKVNGKIAVFDNNYFNNFLKNENENEKK
jgi:hypothetical protein